jgi:hypothetical protein
MFQVDKDGLISWVKSPENASNFLEDKTVRAAVSHVGSYPINVGHVRAATSGSITTDNAHPFLAKRKDGTEIIGVHNGSMSSGWRSHPKAKDFSVDSAWMFHMLASEGADAFEYFNGPFALVWYDSAEPDYIFMARNKDRPLCYMVSDDRQTLLGCSELGMLGWLSTRNGFKLAKEGTLSIPFYLGEGKIYKFSLKDLGNFETVEYPQYKPPVSVYTALTHYQHYPRSANEFDDSLDPWDDDFSTRYHSRRPIRDYRDYYEQEQEDVITKVKEALQEARYTPVRLPKDEEPIVVEVQLDDYQVEDVDTPVEQGPLTGALRKALSSIQSPKEPKPVEVTKTSLDDITLISANTSSATLGEVNAAKALGIFGRVIKFTGLEYDDEMNTLLGWFDMTDLESGENIECDGEIRYIPSKVANDLYIDRGPHLAVVIGYHSKEDWCICEMPSPKEKAFIYSQLGEYQNQAAIN